MMDRPNPKPGPCDREAGPRGSPGSAAPSSGPFGFGGVRVLRIDLRPDDGKALRAFADIEIGTGIIIRAFRIIEHQGKRAVVHCPQACVKANGRPAYFKTLVILPDSLKGEIDLTILYAWRQALNRQRGKVDEGLDSSTPKNF